MKCPNCDQLLLITERHHVEIDYCPSCRGVWLDKGELDKLIDFASSRAAGYIQAAPPPPQQQQTGYGHSKVDPYYSKKHRKKNIFGDLFDFD